MRFYDIFNGDADGICALHQLRLAEPRPGTLVTGVKRDIKLLERVPAQAGDMLTVLDINLRDNLPALNAALERGARCLWFDHHAPGEIPRHPSFEPHIQTGSEVCTSLLVDRHLKGLHRAWAVVGAFGDNLTTVAQSAAVPLGLHGSDVQRLRELGQAINYNAYGETEDDLHYPPAELYLTLSRYPNPLEFIADEPIFDALRSACADDMARADDLSATLETPRCAAYVLPDSAWARRVNGELANRLAREDPTRAHAVLVQSAGGYRVSVRAPLERPLGADLLCGRFETGGGRAGAGGINHLPEPDLERFLREFAGEF